jgi:hypothetical protein
MDSIIKEAERAEAKYGHFNSTHELYGVLKEEVDEFWQEVKYPTKTKEGDSEYYDSKKKDMIHELTQIAAIAYRGIKELENNQIKYV